jgi:hypothetical protein
MRQVHRMVGLAAVAGFLLTGAWMRTHFPEAHHDDPGTRMMYRSAHVYLLLSGLVNLAIGLYWRDAPGRWRGRLQRAGSLLVAAAPAAFALGFFLEPAPEVLVRPWCLRGAKLMLAGMAAQATSLWRGGATRMDAARGLSQESCLP